MKSYILGIETSCDETAASIYDSESGVLSNVLYSQISLHAAYGGVIPELASRSHLEKINDIVERALNEAQISLPTIDSIAVTSKPGLPGSLLIGVCFAKAVAWSLQKKIIGVNHLEGHIFSSFLEHQVPFPHLCLTASGGHTALYLVRNFGDYSLLGQTLDDAAGEAFDKIAKLLKLPYPGGPVIEKLAKEIDFKDYYDYPRGNLSSLDFSFSGLKTAVLYDLVQRNLYNLQTKQLSETTTLYDKQQVASSLLVCIKDIFEQKLKKACDMHPEIKAITFVGGVACNKFIREKLQIFCKDRNLLFFTPSPQYCTDNAAMIAFVGNYKAQQGLYSNYQLDIFQ